MLETTLKGTADRCGAAEATLARICESVQHMNTFRENATTVVNGLVGEVQKHRGFFLEVGRILQAHEEYIAKTGAASQEMAQYITALIQENQKKDLCIGSLMRETQEQTQVLRQHEMKQQVIAEVLKTVVNQQQEQQPQQRGVPRTTPTISEVDDQNPDRLDFLCGQNPNSGPPDLRVWSLALQPFQPHAPMELDTQN